MLTSEQRQQLKEKTASEIVILEDELVHLSEAAQPISPDNAIGRLSRQEAMQDQQILLANLNGSKTRLSRLQRVLGCIDDEGFGLCLQCEEPIPFGRLMLMPESTTCVNCAG
ncbi:MAG: TraR/DksA C4-type zinc finger protein [Mariprofundaceae bacterium]